MDDVLQTGSANPCLAQARDLRSNAGPLSCARTSRAAPLPIPCSVYTLGVAVWRAAYEFLTDLSRACPPTGCQLLLYYSLFQSAIGRHRDNYTDLE